MTDPTDPPTSEFERAVTTQSTLPSTERLVQVLSDEQRREALSVLADAGGDLPIDELAAAVTEADDGSDADGTAADAVRFRYAQIPELERANLVAFDQRTELVVLTDAGATVESRL